MSDEYAVKEVVEPRSGKVHRLYTYKRKPCRRVVLDTKLAAQLAGYTLIEKDLRNVLVWLAEIDRLHSDGPTRKADHYATSPDREKYNLIKGLFVAALTFYGKCFSKCEGRPVKLERVQLREEFRVLHDTCMKYRHNFAAHSGAERLEHVEIVVVLPLQAKKAVLPNLYREIFQPDLLSPSNGELKLSELIEHVREVVIAKIDLLSKKILKEEVLPMGYEYWLKR
jgi:hypothetical protein